MPTHPYRGLPPDQFWSTGVVEALDPVRGMKFTIAPTDPVAAAGSCFAQHIARFLKESGYNYLLTEAPGGADEPVFSARFGNIYTARQLRQLLLGAFGLHRPATRAWRRADGRFIDPLRPHLFPAGFATLADVAAARRTHLAAVRRVFQESRVFIFTLGLTEAWLAPDGTVLPVPPGALDAGTGERDAIFHNFTAAEIRHDLDAFLADFVEVNPKGRVILTVSPVPLAATYVPRHVLVSNTYSKAALLVAAGETAQAHEHVAYFPAYEIVTAPHLRGAYFGDDLRGVTAAGVAAVLRSFAAHALRPSGAPSPPRPAPAPAPPVVPGEAARARYAALSEIFCDDALLDPLGQDGSPIPVTPSPPEASFPPVTLPARPVPAQPRARQDAAPLPAVMAELGTWADRELKPWRENGIDAATLESEAVQLSQRVLGMFVFQFADGTVRLFEKPASGSDSEAVGQAAARAVIYRRFFEDVTRLLPADFSASVIVCLADRLETDFGVPVFAFQRHVTQRAPLLPDIDLLNDNFLADGAFDDPYGFLEKENRAVFAGATTGGRISEEVARSCGLPRLRAARFFLGSAKVDFRLPRVVQTDSGAAYDLVAAQPFCRQSPLTWEEQFRFRFLISMDGNGATCQRVAVALRSNSVLLKYRSEQILYYFPALAAGRHFIDISRDEDVAPVIDAAAADPVPFAAVAAAGREFSETFLTRAGALAYTARLLLGYRDLL
jgi:hypothetical protein